MFCWIFFKKQERKCNKKTHICIFDIYKSNGSSNQKRFQLQNSEKSLLCQDRQTKTGILWRVAVASQRKIINSHLVTPYNLPSVGVEALTHVTDISGLIWLVITPTFSFRVFHTSEPQLQVLSWLEDAQLCRCITPPYRRGALGSCSAVIVILMGKLDSKTLQSILSSLNIFRCTNNKN